MVEYSSNSSSLTRMVTMRNYKFQLLTARETFIQTVEYIWEMAPTVIIKAMTKT